MVSDYNGVNDARESNLSHQPVVIMSYSLYFKLIAQYACFELLLLCQVVTNVCHVHA